MNSIRSFFVLFVSFVVTYVFNLSDLTTLQRFFLKLLSKCGYPGGVECVDKSAGLSLKGVWNLPPMSCFAHMTFVDCRITGG